MSEEFNSDQAPEPVGHYPHARRIGNLLFLSGLLLLFHLEFVFCGLLKLFLEPGGLYLLPEESVVVDVVSPEEKDRMNEVMKFHNHMKDLESKGYGYRNPQDKQDFNWTDMKARKTHWKSIDYKRIK